MGHCVSIEPVYVQVNIMSLHTMHDIFGCMIIVPLGDKYGMFV